MFKEEIYDIYNELDNINARIDSLCNAVNTNIASLQTIIDVMQDNDYVDSITPIVENGVTIGYEIVFTQSGSVKIYHGEKGETGATGHSPVVGVKQAEDGRWYWTIDGEWMVNAEGKKILAEAIDGEDGAPGSDGIPGVDGITPKLKVQDNYWYISYDNGTTWERLGKATGEAGADGDSMFQSVNYNEDYVELVLVDGTVLTIPTWASHMLLVDEIAKINNNISAIQAAVKALESNDYVQKVTPVEDKEGNVIGYTLQFAFTGDVTIYHGEDGEKGEDGHTPVIGVKQFNGEWYWTIDGEWLVDGNGEMVPTSGEDGAEGAEGQAGITPELKIEDDYWYVSYDKGQTWTKLGKAKGEDGAAGGDGAAGDAFFEDVDTSDEYYIILTLADGTEIKIPTWKAHQALADAVAQLNTNFESLQVIITGLQNNDYITGYTPIIDPQTNEEIGYTLHFLKAGDIEIYHGTSPAAPEIGIKKHPQYGLCWTYDGEYIKDPSTGKPVALPQDGADAVAPKFKIEDGRWWMSTDGGRSWEDIGQATGDQGQQGETGATGGAGDSFFKSIEPEFATDANGNVLKDAYGKPIVAYIVMTLAGDNDGEDVVYKVPTEYITSDINKRLAAIEAQFSTISTIVNALQNAEYIKEVVELYEGPALVGYEITFVKYAIGADGKLTETTRKSTIRNGGAGAAGTVVAAEYDEATDTWYWTLDGEPLKDADGNYVAINGKNGQAGVTPLMRINTDTNEWEVSYDNGKTYTTTGVKATGPQGPQGNPGQGGAAGDSFFADVYKDGDYWVFERVDGNKIMVPTAEAFASLAEKVAALDESSKAFASLINGKKFIESCEPFTNDSGSGYKLVLVSLNAETGETVKEDYFIFNGEDAETPVVGLRQDETTGDWYWTVDGEDILVDGKPVKANGPQGIDGPVPSFRIDPTNGHLYVTVNGTESDLGRVVGTNGSAGEAGSSSSIVVTPGEDGQLTIDFIGGDGLTSTIVVPSWEAFVALQKAVSALNTNVETISALVYGHKYVESFKELENGGYEFVVRYYDENAKEWKTEVHAIDITTADEIGVKMDPEDENYYWTKGGEWLLDAAGNKVMVDGSAERTLEFKSENDGKLYYKYSDETEWTVIDIAVSESVVESNVVVKEENGKVTVTVLDDKGMILYTFSAPSWEAFEALQGRVIALEEQVTDIYDLIDQLTTNYQALSGDVKNMAAKLAKCKFIGEYEYDAERKGNVIYLVDIDGNKLQNAAGEYETIFIADGEDFDASMLGFTEVDGEYFWTYNGEMLVDAAGKPVKAHGADGRTPEFDLIDDELVYRYEGDEEWISLGNVKGSAAAANITVDPSDVPMWIEIEYSYVDEDGKESVSKIKVPTYHAYEMAVQEIAAIQSNIDLVEEFLNKGKFVADYELEYDENGMIIGCTMTTVEYKLQEDGSYRVFTSPAEFKPSQTMHLEVDENEGVWYLVGYKKGEDGKIEEVRRPLSQSAFTFVPKIAVDKGYIYLAKVSVPGTDYTDTQKWECLGAVVELLGGETGSAQGALKSVEEIDGYICFTFSNGDVLKVPSDAKFQEVLDRLDEVEGAVETIQGTITEINGSLASLSEKITALEGVQGNYLTSADFESWKNDARFVQNVTKNGDVWSFVVADGNGKAIEGAGFDITATHHVSTYEKDGVLYWVINGKETEYPVESKPKFRVTGSGNLEFSFDGKDWTTLESASNAVKVVFTNDPYPTEGEWVEVAAADALWAGIYYSEENIIWMPTYLNFKNIEGRLAKVEGDVVAIQGSIATINGSLASLSEKITALEGVQGNYLTSAQFQAWKDGARFVQNVTKNGDVWSFVVADGNGKAIEGAGFDITATHHVSTYEKDGVLYWVINGKETEYPVESKPKFRVTGSGNLEFSFDGKDWTTLESASNAVKVVFTNDPYPTEGEWVEVAAADALWAGIYYSEENIIWMPTYLNFKDIEERLVGVEDAVETIQNDIVDLTTSLTALETELAQVKENQAKYLTSAEFEEWKSETQFVKSVVKDGEKLTFEVVKGNGDPVETVEYNVNHPVSTYKNKDGELYWVINGKETEYPVESKPKFRVTGSGNLEFSFDGKDWTTLESASNNVVDVVFTNDPYPTEGEWVKVAAADALWAGIYYGENNIIWMPTYKNFNELVATVTRISEKVTALDRFVTGRSFVKDFKEVKDDKGNVVGFTATLVDYKYDETSKKYVLNTDTEELTFTYENPVSVIEKDGKYYWHIKTADDYVDILADGSSYPKVELYNGKIYVSVDSRSTTAQADIEGGNEAYWKLMDITQTVDTDTHATCTEETIDGYLYYVIKMWKEDGTTTEIKVPSAAAFSALVEKVTTLENTVAGLQTLLSALDFTFVTGITEKKDASGNVIGIDFTTKTVTDGTVADGTPGSVSFDGLVTPNADGDGFTISGYEGELSWKHDLKFVIENGVIKFSIDGGKTWAEVTLPVDNNTFGKTVEIKETIGSSEVVTGYQIYFPDPKDPTKEVGPYEVRKWFTTPVITFGTEGTLDLGTSASTDVTCTITGSFTEAPKVYAACEGHFTSSMGTVTKVSDTQYTVVITVKPTTAYAGDNLGGKLTVYCPYYGNTGIGQINLKAMGAGDLVLKSTNIEPLTILEKPANDATASITFRLEGEDAPPSNRLPVIIDNNYTLTDVQSVVTNNGTKDVETGSGFSQNLDYEGKAGWITLGDFEYEATTNEFTQHFTLDDNESTTNPRTGAVVVFSPSGREVARFVIKQDAATPITGGTNLAVGQSANCYIITTPGRYELPAYMGAHKDLANAPFCTGKPDEVWNDSGNTLRFLQANFSDNKIIFEVESVEAGNAIIGIRNPKNENDILWSWHLWFCPNGTPGTQTYPAGSDGKVYTLMDRNLGAKDDEPLNLLSSSLTYWTDGLFYQWGRKDPIRLDEKGERANTEAAKNADVQFDPNWNASDSWTASKAVTDPCPPGYKVPSSSVWRGGESDGTMELLTKYALTDAYPYDVVSGNIQAAVVYPYLGYIDNSGSMIKGIASATSSESTLTALDVPLIGKVYAIISPNWSDRGYDSKPDYLPVRFDELTYRNQDIKVSSYLWTSSTENAILYGYTSKGKEIISYKYQVGEWKQSGYIRKTWKANWTGEWSDIIKGEYDPNTNEWNDKLDDVFGEQGSIRRDDIFDVLNLGQSLTRSFLYDKKTNNVKSANPVRCVAE